MDRHRQAVIGGRLPEREELRLSERLPGLKRDAYLNDIRVVLPPLDFLNRRLRVPRVQADGPAEPLVRVPLLEPSLDQHLVVGAEYGVGEVAVRQVAARHRVKDRDVHSLFTEKMLGDQRRVGAGVAALRALGDVRVILASGRAVPVHLHVRNASALVRLVHELSDLAALPKEHVDARIDNSLLFAHLVTTTSPFTTFTGYVRMLHSGLTDVVPVASSNPHWCQGQKMNSPTRVSTAPPGTSESTSACPPRRPLQSGPPSCGQKFVIAKYLPLTLKTPRPYLPIGTSLIAPGGSSSSRQTTCSRDSVRSSVATCASSPLTSA